jgi:hypothetical protein
MVRHRFHQTITPGRFNDGLKWARAMNADAKKNGWVELKTMAPGFGPINEMILEWEYADFAAFEQAQKEFYSNAQAMATFRSGIELNAPGTHAWDEVEVSVEEELA